MTDARLPADHGSDPGGLRGRVVRGLTWTVIHTWGGQALSLLVFIILARLLTPAEFGLVALAVVFVALAQLVVDQGLGDALVQRPTITATHTSTAFWVAMATGLLLSAAGFGLAIPIAAAVREPDLVAVLQVLSVTFILSALTSVPMSLLTRELQFRLLAIRAIVSIVGGGIVGVGMALLGFGVWALVGQQIAAAALSVLLLWRVTDWRPGWHVSWTTFMELFPFGARVVGSDILGFVSRNADNFLIGIFLGTVPLGIYAVGYRILDTSQRLLINVARKITFPAFSRLQHDEPRLRRAYLRATRAGSVLILPGYIGLAIIAPELVTLLFGETWSDSGPVAAILFVSGPVLGVQAFSGSLLYAAGHPEVVLRFRVISTLANVLGFAAAVPFGILAVAAAFTVRGYLLLPLLLIWTRRYAAIPIGPYLAQLRGTVLATAAMVAGVWTVKLAAGDHLGLGDLVAVEIVVAGVTFAVALWLVERRLFSEVWSVAGEALPRMSRYRRHRANAPTEAASLPGEDRP